MSTFISTEGGKLPVLPVLTPGKVRDDGTQEINVSNLIWSNGAILVEKDRLFAVVPAMKPEKDGAANGKANSLTDLVK